MTKVFLRVHKAYGCAPAYYPSDKISREITDRYKHNDIVRAEIKRPRNPKHHRKYWALLQVIHESTAIQDLFPTTQRLHEAIKGALGYWHEVKLPGGESYKVVDSIAYESMSQDDFAVFYDKTVDLIVTQVVPNLDRDDLEKQIQEMCGE